MATRGAPITSISSPSQDEAIAAGAVPTRLGALDMQQAATDLVRAAREMTVFAFDNAGTTVVYATNPLQRCSALISSPD